MSRRGFTHVKRRAPSPEEPALDEGTEMAALQELVARVSSSKNSSASAKPSGTSSGASAAMLQAKICDFLVECCKPAAREWEPNRDPRAAVSRFLRERYPPL